MSLISVSSLSKSFGAEDIFREVSFSIAKGARFALVGPNGIGKRTFFAILSGWGDPSPGPGKPPKTSGWVIFPKGRNFKLEGTIGWPSWGLFRIRLARHRQ